MATITASKRPEIHAQDCCAEKGKIFNASCEPVLTEDNDSCPKEIEQNVKVRKIRGMDDEECSRYEKHEKESERLDSITEKENIFYASCRPDLIENKGSGSKGKEKKVKFTYDSRAMGPEEYRMYIEQVNESEGFDVGRFKGSMIGQIKPLIIESEGYKKTLPHYCQEALQVYNTNEETNYKFHEVVKANIQPRRGLMYFITFKARDPSDQTFVIFQAKVLLKIAKQGIRVDLCRKKPTQ